MKKTSKSVAEYAKEYGCSQRTIANWKAQGAPLSDPHAMGEWIAARHSAPAGSESVSLQGAKLELIKLQCIHLAKRNDVADGKFIAKDEDRRNTITAMAEFDAALEALAGDAPQWAGLPPHDIQTRVRKQIAEIREKLHLGFTRLNTETKHS